MKTLDECVRTLVTCAGGDGNLLLNVGPMPTGEIEARQADRLREIGAWLSVNRESIRGTRGGPFLPGSWGVSTHRERNVYVHVLRWPTDGALVLPALERRIVGASVVGGGVAEATQSATGTTIRVAAAHRQPIDTVVRLELDGPAGTLAPR
jgi:alpha-L-fucosidase